MTACFGMPVTVLLRRLCRCNRGQGLAEYGMLLAVLTVGAATSTMVFERQVSDLWSAPTSALASVSDSGSPAPADANVHSHVLSSSTLRSARPEPRVVAGDASGSASATEPPWTVVWYSIE